MKKDRYVYLYLDPRTNPATPIYVGKGHGKRDRTHLKKAFNPFLQRKIQRIREAGLEPIILREADLLTPDEACRIERECILKYGREDLGTGPLCNFTEGGEGTVGFRHRPETKLLFSAQRKGKPQTEAQYQANCNRASDSPETRAKKSAANKGHRRHTTKQLEAIREWNRNRTISEETKALWSRQRKGRKLTPDHVAKVVGSTKRNRELLQASMTPEAWTEYLAKKYASRCGKKRSEETKQKMREAWARRRARSESQKSEV